MPEIGTYDYSFYDLGVISTGRLYIVHDLREEDLYTVADIERIDEKQVVTYTVKNSITFVKVYDFDLAIPLVAIMCRLCEEMRKEIDRALMGSLDRKFRDVVAKLRST